MCLTRKESYPALQHVNYRAKTESTIKYQHERMKMLPDQIPERDELHLWKLFRSTRAVGNRVSILEYRCPMHYQTDCTAGLHIVIGNGFEQLKRFCSHDLDSHIRQAAMSDIECPRNW
jgi:hypothetical protein